MPATAYYPEVARPLKVRVSKLPERFWLAYVDLARGGGWEFGSGDEADGLITWKLDRDVDLPYGVERGELEAALAAECERLAQHGYTDTSELDRHIREGRVTARGN